MAGTSVITPDDSLDLFFLLFENRDNPILPINLSPDHRNHFVDREVQHESDGCRLRT
jgi:hypothetical protein